MKKSTYSTYSVSNNTPWFKWLGAACIFGAFIALMWYATSNKDILMANDEDLELVHPLNGPVKIRATEPGGMKVADRDRQIFDLLDITSNPDLSSESLCDSTEGEMVCNEKLPKVTLLAAKPEAALKANESIKLKPKNSDIAMLIEGYETVKTETPKLKLVQPVAAESKANNKVIEVEPIPTKEESVKETNIPVVQPISVPKDIKVIAKEKLYTGGAWGVQLASYKSLKNADKGANILLKKFPGILKPLTYVTEKVDIKDKGRFYRIQFIGLKDKSSAKTACETLKSKGQGCWYVSR